MRSRLLPTAGGVLQYFSGIVLPQGLQVENLARHWIRVGPQRALQVLKAVVEVGGLEKGKHKRCAGHLWIRRGGVVAVGAGKIAANGESVPLGVAAGEWVKFRDYAGSEVRIEGSDYIVVRASDCLAKWAA